MTHRAVLQTFPLGTPWPTIDPFLFVVHHRDAYPTGRADLGPDAALDGRSIGQDFAGIDGWNMYHGATVPGFPAHPHRGFETITYVRSGLVDHTDSLGAGARYGRGDTQWLTAGAGIVHAEMFPLVDGTGPNPLELFQIWLNLPSSSKMADPYFAMLWAHETPTLIHTDDHGRNTEVVVIAGSIGGRVPPPPPPDSWAAQADSDVAVWHLEMAPGATWTLPAAASPATRRVLYVCDGSSVRLGADVIDRDCGALVDASNDVNLTAGAEGVRLMLLQGRPIGEPVVQYGPFVLNDEAGIRAAFDDYQRTRFGGWPWDRDDPVHSPGSGRFARHADGRLVEPAP